MAATIEVSNILKLNKSDLTVSEIQSLYRRFTFKNPIFQKNQRLGFPNFAIPKTINLIHDNGNGQIELPRGVIGKLSQEMSNFKINDQTVVKPVNLPHSKIILKDYQKLAIEKIIKRYQGILVGFTGCGKTVIAIEILTIISQKTLVLVHTIDLDCQWGDRLREFADIDPGHINSKQYEVKDVTIATVQSLNRPLERSFTDQFGCIIVDECHHVPAFTFRNLISQFPARYRLGLSATPERNDGLSFLLYGIMGSVLSNICKDQLFQKGYIMKPYIKAVFTNFYLPFCNSYSHLIDNLCEDNQRNKLILKYIKKEAESGNYCLVLSERIKHIKTLHEEFSNMCPEIKSVCITSKNKKSDRREAIKGDQER